MAKTQTSEFLAQQQSADSNETNVSGCMRCVCRFCLPFIVLRKADRHTTSYTHNMSMKTLAQNIRGVFSLLLCDEVNTWSISWHVTGQGIPIISWTDREEKDTGVVGFVYWFLSETGLDMSWKNKNNSTWRIRFSEQLKENKISSAHVRDAHLRGVLQQLAPTDSN